MTDTDPRFLAIRTVLMPRDTNEAGTIFGGVIMSHIDLAGGVEAYKHHDGRIVTVSVHELLFKKPVYVGDIVSFYTRTLKKGTTSVTVHVDVEVQRRHDPNVTEKVTEAEIVYVAVDEHWKPTPLRQ